MSFRIYGITYGDKTTGFIPFRNEAKEKLWRFEYNPMIEIMAKHIHDLPASDYLGIFSWKFTQKTGISKNALYTVMRSRVEMHDGAEVYNLSPNLGDNIAGCGCFMDWSSKGHGETLRTLIKECCTHTGMIYYNNPKHIVYANQFIATKLIYQDYMEEVIKPCLELLEGPLWTTANQSAKYTAGVAAKELKQQTFLDFYNYIPFVLERMMMQFIENWKIKTVSLV